MGRLSSRCEGAAMVPRTGVRSSSLALLRAHGAPNLAVTLVVAPVGAGGAVQALHHMLFFVAPRRRVVGHMLVLLPVARPQ